MNANLIVIDPLPQVLTLATQGIVFHKIVPAETIPYVASIDCSANFLW